MSLQVSKRITDCDPPQLGAGGVLAIKNGRKLTYVTPEKLDPRYDTDLSSIAARVNKSVPPQLATPQQRLHLRQCLQQANHAITGHNAGLATRIQDLLARCCSLGGSRHIQEIDLTRLERPEQIAVVSGQEMLGANPVDALTARFPELREHYERPAGVSEGYTIGEHSKRVIETARSHRTSLAEITHLVSWEHFELFLALHDIGKNMNSSAKDRGLASSMGAKRQELVHTQLILRKILGELQFDPAEITLFEQLLAHDSLGLYLRGIIAIDEAYHQVSAMARACQIPASAFFDLFQAYHMADAASYPGVKAQCFVEPAPDELAYCDTYIEKVRELRERFHLAERGQTLFSTVHDELHEAQDLPIPQKRKALQHFLEALPALRKHLEQEMFQLIEFTEAHPADRPPDRWLQLHKSCKQLLRMAVELAVALDPITTGEWARDWVNSLLKDDGAGGQLREFSHGLAQAAYGRDRRAIDEAMESFPLFQFTAIDFRTQVLCAYKPDRIRQKADGNMESREPAPQGLPLKLRTRFMHGSNTAILPGLLQTDFQLACVGRLKAAGIITLSGEMREGSGATGVNQRAISGCGLTGTKTVVGSYARETFFHVAGLVQERKALDGLYQSVHSRQTYGYPLTITKGILFWKRKDCVTKYSMLVSIHDAYCSMANPFIPTSIRRMRLLASEEFARDHEQRLRDIAQLYDEQLAEFKTSQEFRNHMPSNKVKGGRYQGQDPFWYHVLRILELNVKEIHQALDEPISPLVGRAETIERPTALVFTSRTLPTEPLGDLRGESYVEIGGLAAAAVGIGIQDVYTEAAELDRIRNFFTDHCVDRPLPQFHPIEELEQTAKWARACTPYFRDLLGAKAREALLGKVTAGD